MLWASLIASLATSVDPHTPSMLWRVPLSSVCFGSAAIADVDGDGRPEVAFATYFNDSRVYVLRGSDGQELWREEFPKSCLDASCRFVDLDEDNALELVVPVSSSSQVVAFNARTGARRWTTSLGDGECIDTPPWIGQIRGKWSIVVGTFKGKVFMLDGLHGEVVRTLKVAPGAVQSCPLVFDLSGDSIEDVVVGNFRGDHAIHAVDGETGKEHWSFATKSHIYHGPSLGDIDLDGELDLVFGSYDGNVYALRSRDGSEMWNASAGDHYIMSPTTLLDAVGDRHPEVAVASEFVTLYDHQGGTIWTAPASPDAAAYDAVSRGVSVTDLDGDGTLDLIYLTARGRFVARRATDGAVISSLDVANAVGIAADHGSHCPTIADLNGDGKVEVFLVVGNPGTNGAGAIGEAVCLTGFEGSGPAWTQMRRDRTNTGNVAER